MAFGFDPSIILSAKQSDPLELPRTLAQLANMGQQRQVAQASLADLLRKQEQERTLADILQQNAGDLGAVGPAAMRAGLGSVAVDWMDRQAQAESRKASAQKMYQDNFRQRAELLGRPFRGVKDQAGVDAAFSALLQAGVPEAELSKLPRQYNPQTAPFFERLAALGLSTQDAERLGQRDEEMEARRRDREVWRETVASQKQAAAEEKRAVAQGDDTRDLRKEISGRKEVAKYRQAAAELASLKELAKDSTGANDMALVFAFMKAMDPESVVREAEYAAAAATGRPDERMMGLVSKYWTGGKLSPGQRQAFIKAAEAAQSGHKAAYEKARKTYEHVAKKRGYDPKELGLDDEAQSAGPHGLTVTQGGHTYTWNPETGAYE